MVRSLFKNEGLKIGAYQRYCSYMAFKVLQAVKPVMDLPRNVDDCDWISLKMVSSQVPSLHLVDFFGVGV